MKIQDLREIGKLLFAEIGTMRLRPFTSEPLGKGAGGDKTFMIDKKAEDIIISSLESLREPLCIVSEEYGLKELRGGGARVIIDPVDGSKNAITGIPFYCSSIAVAKDDTVGSLFLGYVINLVTGDEFWAEKGKGAFFNGERITTQRDGIFYVVAYEAPNPKENIPYLMKLFGESRRARCFGSTALSLSYVAYGATSAFICPAPSRSFDFAAGKLLVNEAGGVVTTPTGDSIEGVSLGLKRNAPLLASGNAALHEKAVRLLNR